MARGRDRDGDADPHRRRAGAIHSEAGFARLCDACPGSASSGKTSRHRLNCGGHPGQGCDRGAAVRVRSHQPAPRRLAPHRRRGGPSGKSSAASSAPWRAKSVANSAVVPRPPAPHKSPLDRAKSIGAALGDLEVPNLADAGAVLDRARALGARPPSVVGAQRDLELAAHEAGRWQDGARQQEISPWHFRDSAEGFLGTVALHLRPRDVTRPCGLPEARSADAGAGGPLPQPIPPAAL